MAPSRLSKGGPENVYIRPEIFNFEPELGLKLGQNKPTTSGTAHTDRHITMPSDSGPMSVCFHDGPKLLHCEMRSSAEPWSPGNTCSWPLEHVTGFKQSCAGPKQGTQHALLAAQCCSSAPTQSIR